jgi:hypothetical protein
VQESLSRSRKLKSHLLKLTKFEFEFFILAFVTPMNTLAVAKIRRVCSLSFLGMKVEEWSNPSVKVSLVSQLETMSFLFTLLNAKNVNSVRAAKPISVVKFVLHKEKG